MPSLRLLNPQLNSSIQAHVLCAQREVVMSLWRLLAPGQNSTLEPFLRELSQNH